MKLPVKKFHVLFTICFRLFVPETRNSSLTIHKKIKTSLTCNTKIYRNDESSMAKQIHKSFCQLAASISLGSWHSNDTLQISIVVSV